MTYACSLGYSDAERYQSVCPNKVITGSAAELDPIRKGERLMSKVILSIAMLFILCYCNAVKVDATDTTSGTGEDIVINGHDLRKTVNCNGNNVVVDANDSDLTLRGECKEVKVNGSTNTITIDLVASIVLESADNTVRWKKAANGNKPKIVDRSTGNKVEQVK